MAIRLKLGKSKAESDETDVDDSEGLEDVDSGSTHQKAPRLALSRDQKKRAPIAQLIGVDLDDEDVADEMEAAVKRLSSFGYKVGHIRQHLQNKDYQGASLTTKEALLATLIELVPLAESSLRQSGASKGIYQFNSLINQVRELLVDLDGERDLNNTVMSILEESVRPSFLMLAQMIIQFNNGLKRQFRAELSERDCKVVNALLDEQVRELATYVQQIYAEVLRRVEKKLDG